MGRPNKIGIDYFPFDVDFFNDEKVEFVSARFGIKGEVIAIRLLCKIYRIGYYTDWNEDESTLLAKRAGDTITPSLVSEVVKELVKRGFFDETLLDSFGILTSKGIQKRYATAISERKEIEINRDFWLINPPKNACFSVSPPNNGINPPINSINRSESTQSKVKYSKVEKSKEDIEITARERATPAKPVLDISKRKEKFKADLAGYLPDYGREMLNSFYSYWTEPNKSGTKMRFELERTWDTSRRLKRWAVGDKNFTKGGVGKLLTYNQMVGELSPSNSQDNYEFVAIDGQKLWRRK